MREKNVLLTIAYDGTDFCGWQRQPEKRTVQGELERVLSVLCAMPVKLSGTSRTDGGVHALGQRASFCGTFGIPIERIPKAANNLLAGGGLRGQRGDVRILEAREVPLDFHARFDARGKKYIYKIRNCAHKDVFCRNYYYQVERELDTERMREAAVHMAGTHDFKCFEAAGGQERETTVRTIFSIEIRERDIKGQENVTAIGELENVSAIERGEGSAGFGKDMEIAVTGDGFLYNMVRIITGTLVEAGMGRIAPQEVPLIIESRDRRKAGHTAPPQGLYLAEVYYGDMEKKPY